MSHSQLTHSHTFTLCLLDSLSFLSLLFPSFFFSGDQSRGRLGVAGDACVCKCTHVCDTVLRRRRGYYPVQTQLRGLPSQLQGEERDANAFVTCHRMNRVSNSGVICCTHHTRLPRPATVTHIFLVFHRSSRLRVYGDADAVWASYIQTTWPGSWQFSLRGSPGYKRIDRFYVDCFLFSYIWPSFL